ncbi:FecCD family ABC transporter permease [Gryllotalpicola reticulitermitis]|uniref:FecCD family ABC transporter permease n=1 Tax=Gryllotalpicola reticulitermitis TaxID=1184153 RepID=A0ABV8Q949_9MICO
MTGAVSTLRAAQAHRAPGRSRRVLAASVSAAVALALGLVALGIGDYPLSIAQVVHALVHDDGFATTVVVQWRLPRVAAALVFGAALGVSGALFQSLTRNPLGSPDVIGFSSGSYTGVLIGITLLPGLGIATGIWALAGGILSALIVYLLAYRRGVHGIRLIVTGIGVTAMLQALNVWLQLRAQTDVAMTASFWAAGSLGTVAWPGLWLTFAALAACAVLVLAAIRPLRQLELGDDHAAAHGLRVEAARLGIVVLGVVLTALPTAVAGPIAFVALASPQVSKRLAGGAGLPIGQSALTGAVLLLASDQLAQHALPQEIPVGIVTIVLGGLYLIALLARGARGPRGVRGGRA